MTAAGARPLAGVRVLSFAEQYPGPYATLLLGDLGADVVQVERPAGGDPARRYPAFHEALNRGKRSVVLDLKDPRAVAVCAELARTCDVVLEGFRPGVMDRLGLGPDRLRAASPELVYVSISGFGQSGPYRDRTGHDLSYQALAGTLRTPGEGAPGEAAPEVPSLTLADLTSGLFAAIAALTGLVAAQRTGNGAHYDVSMFDSLVSLLTAPLSAHLDDPDAPSPGEDPAYGLFPTSDGRWLSLAVAFEDHHWQALCGLVGMQRHASLPHPDRVARRAALRDELAQAVARQPLQHWESALSSTDLPFGRVHGLDDLARDVHVQARGLVQRVGSRSYVRQPLTVDGTQPGPARTAPALGEHTGQVLRSAGIADELVAELLTDGAASAAPPLPRPPAQPAELSSR